MLEVRGLIKTFREGGRTLEVLCGVELTVTTKDRLAIIGASGSGKTTLLTLIGALRSAQEGTVRVLGHDLLGAKGEISLLLGR